MTGAGCPIIGCAVEVVSWSAIPDARIAVPQVTPVAVPGPNGKPQEPLPGAAVCTATEYWSPHCRPFTGLLRSPSLSGTRAGARLPQTSRNAQPPPGPMHAVFLKLKPEASRKKTHVARRLLILL